MTYNDLRDFIALLEEHRLWAAVVSRISFAESKHLLLLAALLLACGSAVAATKSPFPANVDIWNPAFNTERQRIQSEYRPLGKAQRRWRICVSIPHLKDAYWVAVNYGLIDAAKRLNVAVRLYSAGGYGELEVQRRQVDRCLEQGYDGLILGAVHATELNDSIAHWAERGKPVISARMGLDTMVRILEGRDFHRHLGPRIQLVDSDALSAFDTFSPLAPRGFRAIFSIND